MARPPHHPERGPSALDSAGNADYYNKIRMRRSAGWKDGASMSAYSLIVDIVSQHGKRRDMPQSDQMEGVLFCFA